jgi:hypothetical protein
LEQYGRDQYGGLERAEAVSKLKAQVFQLNRELDICPDPGAGRLDET